MRLLIVDDDAGLRQSLTLLLEEAGYQVAAEADPEQALRRAGSEAFDLILCDVRMPRSTGSPSCAATAATAARPCSS